MPGIMPSKFINIFFNYALENKRTFTVIDMEKMETEYILLTHRVKTIYNEAAFKSFMGDLNMNLRDILSTCRNIWVKFDATQMSQGLLITLMPLFFAFVLINNSRAIEFYKIFTLKEMFYTYLLNLAAGVFGYRYYKNFSFKTEEHGIIFFTNIISTVILVFHTVHNWSTIALNWSKMKRFGDIPTRIVLFFAMYVFFSNSFIIQEAKILSYLLTAIIILLINELLQKSVRLDFRTKFKLSQFVRSTTLKLIIAGLMAIVCLRMAYSMFRCREEQGNCTGFSTNPGGFSFKKPSSGKTYLLSVVIIVLYTTLTRLYLRSCGNLTGSSVNVLLARYGPTVAAICVGGHILLAHSNIKNIERSHIDAMALVVYSFLLIQIVVVSLSPLMIYVLPPKTTTITVSRGESFVPEIFKKIKRMYDGDESERRYEIPVVYGLATIYSSIIITFSVFLTLVLIILLEPKSSMGLIICITVAAIILTLHGILRFRTAVNFETCIQPTFAAIAGWFLLAHFCFFATSHQTTLSQIDWRAAFIGRSTNIGHSTFLSAILVVMNTFCGHILFFSMYSLLCTESFSVFALFPQLIRTYNNRENRKLESSDPRATNSSGHRTISDISNESIGFDMTRGELVLFENEAVFIGTLFKVATQLFMLQGLKVLCSMLACTIHCRHLMVWKIFAPRFIYEALATFVSFPALIIGYLLVVRIHCAVDKLIHKVNKIK